MTMTVPPAPPLPARVTAAPTSNGRAFAALLWRRRLVLLLVAAIVAATVAVGLSLVERQYTATARIAVSPAPEVSSSPVDYQHVLGTVADVAESRPLLDQVSESVPFRSTRELEERVESAPVTGTVLVQVSVTDTDPELAAEVANAVAAAIPAFDPAGGTLVYAVTEPAVVPRSAASPNVPVTILAGALLALLLGVAAAAVVDRLFRTVDTAAETQAVTGLDVLGVLPRPRQLDGLPAADPTSREFGALRALRVALEFASSEEPTRTVVVAPAVPDPGSGWLAVNLAAALAEVGHRVLLVDASRTERGRHPVLAAPDEAGFYDVLAGEVTVAKVLRPGPVDGVSVLPLGNADLAAPSLLEMRFRCVAEQVTDHDVILVHAAAVTASDDARVMAIDGSLLLTVPSRRVQRAVLERAVRALRDVRTRVLGAVLTGGR